MKLSLDCMTLTNTLPTDLIRGAHSAGFDRVSLWLQPPACFPLQLVTADNEPACAAALAETGIEVGAIEVFDLSTADVASYRPALELGARLGAKTAVAINTRNPDTGAVTAALAKFAALAAEFGLGVNFEPIAICRTATLAQARELIRAADVDAGIVLDIYHLVHSGGTAADIRAMEPGLIRHVQINDGMASPTREQMFIEAGKERPYPGEGVFPLVELLSATPNNIPWAIESPSLRRNESGLSPQAQAAEGMAALRQLLQKVEQTRASA